MKAREESSTWLLFFVILAFALLVAMAAGCAATNQSVEVTAVYSGERPGVQACYKVNMP